MTHSTAAAHAAFLPPAALPTRPSTVLTARTPRRNPHASAQARPPERVAIAGAGIAGLAAAVALRSAIPHCKVSLFEPRAAVDAGQGAAVNLNGGASVLLNALRVDVRAFGVPVDTVAARTAAGARLFDVDIAARARKEPSLRAPLASGSGSGSGDDHTFVTVMRDALQRALVDRLDALGDGDGDAVLSVRRGPDAAVSSVARDTDGRHITVTTADGASHGPFDLVIGADGVRSAVRACVVPQGARSRQYTGFRVQWAITPARPATWRMSDARRGKLEQVFGDGAYVLRYAAGPVDAVRDVIALSFRDDVSADENVAYKMEAQVRDDFTRRCRASRMPADIMEIVARCESFIETGVYTYPPTDAWSKWDSAVLIGDAAHAMAPFLGQGANQAIMDAQCLALALSRVGSTHASLGDALRYYQTRRKPVTDALMRSSGALGWLETQGGFVGSTMRDSGMFIAGRLGLPEKVLFRSAMPVVE